jgi:hypothetical protein
MPDLLLPAPSGEVRVTKIKPGDGFPCKIREVREQIKILSPRRPLELSYPRIIRADDRNTAGGIIQEFPGGLSAERFPVRHEIYTIARLADAERDLFRGDRAFEMEMDIRGMS